jgi:hypothetical protein
MKMWQSLLGNHWPARKKWHWPTYQDIFWGNWLSTTRVSVVFAAVTVKKWQAQRRVSKRMNCSYTTSATLYKCSDHFLSFVRVILQITNHCYAHVIESPQFVGMVTRSVLAHVIQLPRMCTVRMTERLVQLVVRTILVYKLKWLNSDLRNAKKFTRGKKKTAKEKKLEKLTHK